MVNEDYNIVNTPAPNGNFLSYIVFMAITYPPSDAAAISSLHPLDMQAPTPAPVLQNDDVDDDDEPLNENDDDDFDDVDQGEDLNTAHLVLAQFDKVKISFLLMY